MRSFSEKHITIHDLVAQLVEHLTFNQRVLGSNPSQITFKSSSLRLGLFLSLVEPKLDKKIAPLGIPGGAIFVGYLPVLLNPYRSKITKNSLPLLGLMELWQGANVFMLKSGSK